MAGELFLGLDVGTQGTKGLLVDPEAGRVLARASHAYGLIEGLGPGAAEQHPATWEQAAVLVLRELCSQVGGRTLGGLGVSGQQHGLVLLDERDAVLRPAKLWCDTTTSAEARELSELLGRPIPTGYTAPKVLWTQRHEPEIWSRTARVLLPHDWLNLRLTGRAVMEAGDASGTGWFDPVERRFDARALAAIGGGLEQRLPRLIGPQEPVGGVTKEAAQRFGLPEGLLVSAGAGDNMASAIGSGVLAPGRAGLSLGTSGTLFAHSERPSSDPTGWIAPFCGSTGGYLPLLCVMNLTGVAEEVCRSSGLSHGELTRRAAQVPVGSDGLTCLPYLVGERVPDLPLARGVLLGIGPGGLEPGRLYRAALEGTALNLALGASRFRALGIALEDLRVVGGAAANRLWVEILAACLGTPVRVLAEPESAALGVALQAAWCRAGTLGQSLSIETLAERLLERADRPPTPIEPDPHWVRRYADLLQAFRASVERSFAVTLPAANS